MPRMFLPALLSALLIMNGCDLRRTDSANSKAESGPEQVSQVENPEIPPNGKAHAATESRVEDQPSAKRTNVRVATLKPQSLNVQSTYVGHLLPNERVLLRAEIDGVIESVHFEEGDDVRAGQALINISTKELTLRLQMAETDFKLVENNLNRDEKLASRNLIPEAQLDQSRTRRDSARLSRELALINLKKSVISSPLKGTIKTRHVKVGEFLKKGGSLVEILDLERILVKIHIPEQEIMQVREQQQVEVELYALDEQQFKGMVKTIGLEADSRNRSFPVDILLENRKRVLRPGMLARVTFTREVSKNQIVIPRHTILERDMIRVVFVYSNGIAHERIIETGLSQQERVQVLSGLSFGEHLVVEGHTKLTDKEPVNVLSF